MSKCIKQIIIQGTILLYGSNGTGRYFKTHEQYCFERITLFDNNCGACENGSPQYSKSLFYEVIINDEYFYVPDENAAHEVKVWPESHKSANAYWESLVMVPKDWKKFYFEATGFDIRKTEKAQYNGLAMWKRIRQIDELRNNENEQ
jgi:hypothetical protein